MKRALYFSMECYRLIYSIISMYIFSSARSPSDTFLSESETRSTFDLQRRLRLLLGQESFDFNFCFAKISTQDDNYVIYLLQYSDYVPWMSFWVKKFSERNFWNRRISERSEVIPTSWNEPFILVWNVVILHTFLFPCIFSAPRDLSTSKFL